VRVVLGLLVRGGDAVSPVEQRAQAREKANLIRCSRAADKRLIRHKRLKVSDLVESPPAHWRSALLTETMLMAPWFDYTRLRAFNAKALRYRINVVVTLEQLDDGEREFVVDYLRERGL
jgi:hypothetical protein